MIEESGVVALQCLSKLVQEGLKPNNVSFMGDLGQFYRQEGLGFVPQPNLRIANLPSQKKFKKARCARKK